MFRDFVWDFVGVYSLAYMISIAPQVADLANADASEEDKLKAMMKQSGEDWEPSQ